MVPDEQTQDQGKQPDSTSMQQDQVAVQDQIQKPTDGPTNELNLLRSQVQENNRRMQQLLDQMNRPAPKPVEEVKKIDPEEQKKAFFNAPVETVQDIIKQELNKSLEPLQGFVSELKAQSAYDRLKSRLKTDERFKDRWNSALEGAVDEIMLSGKVAVDEPTMVNVIVQAIGLQAIGAIPNPTPVKPVNNNNNVNNNNSNNDMITPPHLRPSGSPTPGSEQKKQYPALSEQEERIRKENGLSIEEWYAYKNMSPLDVVNSTKPTAK